MLDDSLDRDGILRVGGRLSNFSLCYSIKHPAIISKDHRITKMIFAHYYKQVNHQGKGFTINQIRSDEHWNQPSSRIIYASLCYL